MINEYADEYEPIIPRQLILASGSPRRASLLQKAGFVSVKIMIPHVKEGDDPLENSLQKAAEIAGFYPDAIVIGADTVIRLDDRVIGKPKDLEDAKRILASLSGRTHDVATGVCVRCISNDVLVRFEETTHVTFRILTDDMIERYIEAVDVLDKAGAYAIQEYGEDLIENIEGSFTNVIGLPVERLSETLHYVLRMS